MPWLAPVTRATLSFRLNIFFPVVTFYWIEDLTSRPTLKNRGWGTLRRITARLNVYNLQTLATGHRLKSVLRGVGTGAGDFFYRGG